jgi:hypothetical protein
MQKKDNTGIHAPWMFPDLFPSNISSRSDVKLPEGYAGVATNKQLTLFIIQNEGGVVTTKYGGGGIIDSLSGDVPYYQPTCDIAVIYWPSLEPVAFYHHVGNTTPPSSISYTGSRPTSVWGDLTQDLTEWFAENLPPR